MEILNKIPDSTKIPTLYKLIDLYIEEENYEMCALIRKELNKYSLEPCINRESMALFLKDYAKNKYVELEYHLDIAEERAKVVKKQLDSREKSSIKIENILDDYFGRLEK